MADAEKLYDYWQARGDLLPEFCDGEADDPTIDVRQHRIAAVGYDPLVIVMGTPSQRRWSTRLRRRCARPIAAEQRFLCRQ